MDLELAPGRDLQVQGEEVMILEADLNRGDARNRWEAWIPRQCKVAKHDKPTGYKQVNLSYFFHGKVRHPELGTGTFRGAPGIRDRFETEGFVVT